MISPLVDITILSPHKTSPREATIDTITIHVVGAQVTVDRIGQEFTKASKKASSNYGIGQDGEVGLFVEESDRSWCSSNVDNDHRAITIECSSDNTEPYEVNDVVFEKLIILCADICSRNNIKKLLWKADKSLIGQIDKQNMTVHRWFSNKACPGDYLYSRMGEIADRVNELLIEVDTPEVESPTDSDNDFIYRVQLGAFGSLVNARHFSDDLNRKGIKAFVSHGIGVYRVQVGAFRGVENAENYLSTMKSLGYTGFITKT